MLTVHSTQAAGHRRGTPCTQLFCSWLLRKSFYSFRASQDPSGGKDGILNFCFFAHHNLPLTWIKWKRAGFHLKHVCFSCCLSKIKPFYRIKSKHTASPKHSSWNKVDKINFQFCNFSTATMQINSQLFKSSLLSSMSSLWRTRKANILHKVFIYSRGQLLKGFIRIAF